jgi:hypothetical protein
MGASSFESFEHDWDAAVDIGSKKQRVKVNLTRIGSTPESDGQPVFLEEIEAEEFKEPRMLRYRRWIDGEIEGRAARWIRWRVRLPSKPMFAGDSSRDFTLVVTAPNSKGWVHTARFRMPDKKGENERDDPLLGPAIDDAEVISRIESLNYDLWEKGKYWTAGVSNPGEPVFEEIRENSTTLVHYGIVEHYNTVVKNLIETNDTVKSLLNMTENGTLRFWPIGKPYAENNKRIHQETKDAAYSLMELAIRQSLAGGGDETERWYLKPVVGLVEERYKNLVDFYNRRNMRE